MERMKRFSLGHLHTRTLAWPLLGLCALLGSCAPARTTPPQTVAASTPLSSVSFYPREVGLAWSYLPEGDAAGTAPYVLRNLGATLYGGEAVTAYQLTGRGAAQTWYRQADASGVRLLGIAKPGVNISLNPAWQEYPAEGTWRLGLSWQGQSQVTVSDESGKVQVQGTVTYSYLVQDRRRVETPAGTFEVWVVTRQLTDTLGGLFPATQQLWVAPFVGDVRSPEGLLLTGRNFAQAGK